MPRKRKPSNPKNTLPSRGTLPPGTPYFDLVAKCDIHSSLLTDITPEMIPPRIVAQIFPFILNHRLLDYICIDENNCFLGGHECLDKEESELVHVMRITKLTDIGKIAFIIGHAVLCAKRKFYISKKSENRGRNED